MNFVPSDEQKQYLLGLARQRISEPFTDQPSVHNAELDEVLRVKAATFVTLTKQGQLRGCIGTLNAFQFLVDDVMHNAYQAAFEDPRFLPLGEDELADIDIEISVLSHPQSISFTSERDLLDTLEPNIDGVIIEYMSHRATFLPQVWSQLRNKKEFLPRLIQKAGLPPGFDVKKLQVQRYQVTCFSERDYSN